MGYLKKLKPEFITIEPEDVLEKTMKMFPQFYRDCKDEDIPEICPFCGKNVEVTQEDCFGFDNDEWLIYCNNCGLQFGFGKQYETKGKVIEAWNNNYRR